MVLILCSRLFTLSTNACRREPGFLKEFVLVSAFCFLKCCGRVSSILIWGVNGVVIVYILFPFESFGYFEFLRVKNVSFCFHSSRWMMSLSLSREFYVRVRN